MAIPYKVPVHGKPCVFKDACKACPVEASRRPQMCVSLECEHYSPCKKCGVNMILNPDYLCRYCVKRSGLEQTMQQVDGGVILGEDAKGFSAANRFAGGDASGDGENDGTYQIIATPISIPGEPPTGYNAEQKKYYEYQWLQYKGYYRDPTSYAIAHNLILIEIELHQVTSMLATEIQLEIRGKLAEARDRLIKNMRDLRTQLPEREAEELSDDEKSLAMIHASYCKEKGLRSIGLVSRILSPDAIALAPRLHFPVDTRSLLTRLGYQIVDIDEALERFVSPDTLPKDLDTLLLFLGFHLKEKYALQEAVVNMGENLEGFVAENATLGMENTDYEMPPANPIGEDLRDSAYEKLQEHFTSPKNSNAIPHGLDGPSLSEGAVS